MEPPNLLFKGSNFQVVVHPSSPASSIVSIIDSHSDISKMSHSFSTAAGSSGGSNIMMAYSPLDEVARRRQLFREQNPLPNRPILHLNPTSAFSTVSSTTEGPSPRSPLTPLTSASEARSYTPRGTPPAFVRRRTLIQVPRSPTEYPDNIDHVQILRTDKDSNVGTDIHRRSDFVSRKEHGSRGPAERELLAGMTEQLLWTSSHTDQAQIREPLRSAPGMMDRRFPLSVSPQSYQLASPHPDAQHHSKTSPFSARHRLRARPLQRHQPRIPRPPSCSYSCLRSLSA